MIISDYVSEPNQIREILKSKELSLAMVKEGELMEEGPRGKKSKALKTQEGNHKLSHVGGLWKLQKAKK